MASLTITDDCGTVVTANIRNESVEGGGGWKLVSSSGFEAECESYCGGTCDANFTETIHDGVKRWLTKCATGCTLHDDCWGVGGTDEYITYPTSGICVGDTLTRAEIGCGSPVDDECWCTARYYYWTCDGNC